MPVRPHVVMYYVEVRVSCIVLVVALSHYESNSVSVLGMVAGGLFVVTAMLSPCGSWAKVVVEDVADFLLSEATAKLKCSTDVVDALIRSRAIKPTFLIN